MGIGIRVAQPRRVRWQWMMVGVPLLLCILATAFVLRGYRLDPDLPHVPTRGLMLHGFGVPVDYQTCGFHTGDDWFAPVGTPVYAIAAGQVVHVGPMWLAGPGVGRGDFAIIVDHGDYYTTYGHNEQSFVAVGDQVERGQQIAEVGDEGYARSAHLHFEKVSKAITPFTGNWQEPFASCEGYLDPGDQWSSR